MLSRTTDNLYWLSRYTATLSPPTSWPGCWEISPAAGVSPKALCKKVRAGVPLGCNAESGAASLEWCRTDALGACAKPYRAQRTPGAVTAGLRLGFELRSLNLTPEMTMTNDRMGLLELIEKSADADLVRTMLAFAAERLMALEIENRT